MLFVVMLNLTMMMLRHKGEPEEWDGYASQGGLLFTLIFLLEVIIKLCGFGFEKYWANGWNKFDFLIVCTSCTDVALEELKVGGGINTSSLRTLRILKTARLLKLLSGSDKLQELIGKATTLVGELSGVVLLFFFLLFMFGCATVELFGTMGCNLSPCEGISDRFNFKSFPVAVLTLVRTLSGDDGAKVLKDTLRVPPQCNDSATCLADCCVNQTMASFTYILFVMFTRYIAMNVVLAMMMIRFTDAQDNKEEPLFERCKGCNQRFEICECDEPPDVEPPGPAPRAELAGHVKSPHVGTHDGIKEGSWKIAD